MTTRERPKRSEVQTPGNTPTRRQRAVSPAAAKIKIQGRRTPGNIYVPRKPTQPKGNLPDGVKALTAPGFATGTVSGAANIVELSRALKHDVDLIFEFVYNNIEFIPTYGSQKGALGSLIDGFGNSFDQSELMIELLREAGYTADFQHGELELTEAEAEAWLGTDSIWASTNLLSNVGIPNETHWTGTEWKLRVDHCWVKVDIDSTDYAFDPAIKAYSVITPTINIETAMDYDRTEFMDDATDGATITSDYVEDMNRTNVRDNLATLTGNLVDYLKTNAPTATLEDIIGGRKIDPVVGPVRQTSLPYLRPMTSPDTWSDIPNAYKATLSVLYDDPNIDVTFYSKDIHGKRLTLTFNGSNECELRLDGTLIATSDPQAPNSWNSVLLSVTHPTADPWWDQSFWQTVWAGHPYLIAQAWGNAGRQMMEIHRKTLAQNEFDGGVPTDENVIGESLSVWFHLWNAEKSWACDVFNRMTNCTTVLQHQLGLVGHFDTLLMDLGGITWSSGALDNNYDNVDTNDTALAMHGIAFEAGAIEQVTDVGGISTTTIIDKAVEDGLKIYDGRSDNWSTNVRPNLTNYATQTLDDIENWYLNWDWRVAIPEDGEITKNDFIGFGYYAISPWQGAIGIFSGYLQGGMGDAEYSQEQLLRAVLGPTAEFYGKSVDELITYNGAPTLNSGTGANHYSPDPVYLRNGTFSYDQVDLTVGSGSFPYSLSFQRFYRSNRRMNNSPLGLGWTHNHNITARKNTDGLTGMSTLNPIQGAAGLAQMYVTIDLYRDLAKPLDKWVTVAISNRWMLDYLRNNVVDVSFPEGSQRFVKLPDGLFVSPLGSANSLLEDGGEYTLITPQGIEYHFNTDGNIETISFPSGPTITYTYSLGKLQTVSNGMGRTLTLTYDGNDLVSVSDGNSRSVSFVIDVDGNLTVASDADDNDTTFEYDLPGRMTKVFKPANPTNAVVSNTYDSLDRVKEQEDGYENTTKFYIAGSYTQLEDPDGKTETKFFNSHGNISKTVDKLGEVWLAEFDGIQRLVKTIAPEGNATEFEYDVENNIVSVRRIAKGGSGLSDLVTSYSYDSDWNKVASLTDPRENVTNFTYDETTGQLLLVEFPEVDGQVPTVAHFWNERGQLLSKIDQTGIQTQFVYDDTTEKLESVIANTNWKATIGGTVTASNVLTITATDVAIAGGTKAKAYTVQSGNTLEDLATGLADAINGDTELSGLNITAKAIGKDLLLSTAPGNTTTFAQSTSGGATATIGLNAGLELTTLLGHDSVGNITSITNAKGDEATFEFDVMRRLNKAIAPVPFEYETKFTYDANGNRTMVERFAGLDLMDEPIWQTSQASYAIDDLLETVTDPGSNVTEFVYNSRRLLHTTEDAASRVVTRSYDDAGRLVSITDPGNVVQSVITFTANGLVATVEDANDNVTEYEHDGFDRVKKKIYPDATFEQNNFDADGRLMSVLTRAGDEIAFGYDDLNRLIERAPDNMPVVTFEYDLAGRQKKVSTPVILGDPSSGVFEYMHDSAGRLVEEKFPDGKQVQYELDEVGNAIKLTYPDAYYVERIFDELNRLTDIKLNGAMGSALVFEFDELSRRKRLTYQNGVVTDYGFEMDNDLNSLLQTFNGSSVEYSYDFNNVHELTSQTVSDDIYLWHPTAGGTTSYGTANNLNQYPSVGGDTYAYNDNGCLTDNDVWTFGYDTINQLISADDGVTSAVYLYDPLGRQTQKNVDGTKTRFIHAGIRIIAEYDGTSGDFLKRYVHGVGLDEVLLEIDDSNVVKSLHHDRIGSIIAITDGSGIVVNSYAYSSWGECDDMTGTTFGFQGQRFDHETGLSFMKARHYDAKIGRFLQPDPLGYEDGLSLYQFAYNNPNSFTDPLGLSADGSRLSSSHMLSVGHGSAEFDLGGGFENDGNGKQFGYVSGLPWYEPKEMRYEILVATFFASFGGVPLPGFHSEVVIRQTDGNGGVGYTYFRGLPDGDKNLTMEIQTNLTEEEYRNTITGTTRFSLEFQSVLTTSSIEDINRVWYAGYKIAGVLEDDPHEYHFLPPPEPELGWNSNSLTRTLLELSGFPATPPSTRNVPGWEKRLKV